MKTEKKDNRFEVVKADKVKGLLGATILRDKETGVQYLLVNRDISVGLTPLLDKDGKPFISGT